VHVRAAVVGGGAMGAAFAADAAAAGQDVTIVDTAAEIVGAIRDCGVTVESIEGTRTVAVRATTEPAGVGAVDLAVILVKGYDTTAVAGSLAGVLGPDAVVVTLQNGWGNADVLASTVPPDRLLMGVTYHSCSLSGPGRVRHTARGPTVVGPYLVDGDLSVAERVAGFLSAAGWQARASAEIRTDVWKKLVLNAATLPASALTGLDAGQVAAFGPLCALVDAVAGEAVAVARALGLPIDPTERIDRIHAVLRAAGSGKPSMLQDVEARRRTEIDTINGAVARMGLELGIDVSLNRAMVALVSAVERSWRS
jgi:2-dehydropantoate 2-reductase